MTPTDAPEVWLRGPVPGIPPLLQPVAHTLLQTREEVSRIMAGFPESLLWERPAGVASVGFHLQHLTGVVERLFTYAQGKSLAPEQLTALQSEGLGAIPGCTVQVLVKQFDEQVEKALKQLHETSDQTLLQPMGVGRKKLPSTVLGLLFHAAEHTQRHTGQLLVTARILRVTHGH